MKERLQNGSVHINYANIDYLEAREVDGMFKLFYPSKPKIKTEMLELPKSFTNMLNVNKFMKEIGYIKTQGFYINKNRFCVVSEGELSKTKREVTFQMMTSNLIVNIPETEWLQIKNSQLR